MNLATVLHLVPTLLGFISKKEPTFLKRLIDSLLDQIEDHVIETNTEIDNIIVLPIIAEIRRGLDIPDNIGGDKN